MLEQGRNFVVVASVSLQRCVLDVRRYNLITKMSQLCVFAECSPIKTVVGILFRFS